MKTKYGWPPALFVLFLTLAACGGKLPGSNSTTTNTNTTTNIFINNNVNADGTSAKNEYVKMEVTQQDALNFLVEWTFTGAFANEAPYLVSNFYINGNIKKEGLAGGKYIWTAENIDGSYILKICIANSPGLFCSNEALVKITAI